ncbi:calcium/sodium antiporter [Desulfococcaceae bacterium HSG9]|nr:calcium/sodium antiporter [Desulfococcaceae bacterium HSG9]
MLLNLFLFIIGLLLLYYGADWLVKGAASMARSFGLTPLVIGLTVVAFGTSAPELVVSVVSAVQNQSMIAVGNVIGSNICNIALVLGVTAIIMPIACHPMTVQRDMPIMLGISLYLLIISYNSHIGRLEGMSLFGGVILYTLFNYYIARKEVATYWKQMDGDGGASSDAVTDDSEYISSRMKQAFLIIVGIGGVVVGAKALIYAAVNLMRGFGVSDKVIGLTVVAFGTSVPELATSIVAAWRKETDISLGNLIGSNVFNILCVLGVVSMVKPITIPGGFIESGLLSDYLVMMVISAMPWLMMTKGYVISRANGVILLASYLGYLGYLIIKLKPNL